MGRAAKWESACSLGARVALLEPGESLGLLALAPHAVRCFSAVAAAAEVLLLCVPRVPYSPAMLYSDVKEKMAIGSVPHADLFQAVLRKDGALRTDHELSMLCDLFRIVPGFHRIHASERRAVCRMLRLVSLPPAATVCHQGASHDAIWIVISGTPSICPLWPGPRRRMLSWERAVPLVSARLALGRMQARFPSTSARRAAPSSGLLATGCGTKHAASARSPGLTMGPSLSR